MTENNTQAAECLSHLTADLEDGLRALVYPTHWQDAPRTHEFVLDTLVCHDFGEPKGQCAICGGYCNKL
jgi:hypothetical protein